MKLEEVKLPSREELIEIIEDFLTRTGVGPHYLGKMANGNSDSVPRLLRGLDMTYRNVLTLIEFMNNYEQHKQIVEAKRALAASLRRSEKEAMMREREIRLRQSRDRRIAQLAKPRKSRAGAAAE